MSVIYYIHITSQKVYDFWINFLKEEGYEWYSGHNLYSWCPSMIDNEIDNFYLYIEDTGERLVCTCSTNIISNSLPISKHKYRLVLREEKLERILNENI